MSASAMNRATYIREGGHLLPGLPAASEKCGLALLPRSPRTPLAATSL